MLSRTPAEAGRFIEVPGSVIDRLLGGIDLSSDPVGGGLFTLLAVAALAATLLTRGHTEH